MNSTIQPVLGEHQRETLRGLFVRYPDVQAVYLFGSVATGKAKRDSDLDLALVPRRGGSRISRLDVLADLARNGFDDVDVVILDTDDVVLKHQAVRLNQLVYAAPDFDHGSYYSRVVRQYLDFLPILETQRAAYKARLLHGQRRSHPKAVAET